MTSKIYTVLYITRWYGDGAGNTVEENSSVFSLFLVSKGMWAVKLCSNKILQFFNDSNGRLSSIMAIKQ